MAFFQVVAVDLDGTLTSGGQVSARAEDAIDQVRRNGLVVALVTGRIGAELEVEFPQIAGHVDALVLENGAVAVIDGTTRALSTPVDKALDDALADRGVQYQRGEVLVAIDGEHAATVVEVIGQLGLDCQIIRNRAALMVLPPGVTKGTGLGAVLAEMNLSPHNTVAVGDAENDLSLLGMAEIGARWPTPSRRFGGAPLTDDHPVYHFTQGPPVFFGRAVADRRYPAAAGLHRRAGVRPACGCGHARRPQRLPGC
jgi:hydroxymethylpyrimidine pyrophosphatase-like HAD family hydrolase